eukprot:gene20701-7630_t
MDGVLLLNMAADSIESDYIAKSNGAMGTWFAYKTSAEDANVKLSGYMTSAVAGLARPKDLVRTVHSIEVVPFVKDGKVLAKYLRNNYPMFKNDGVPLSDKQYTRDKHVKWSTIVEEC